MPEAFWVIEAFVFKLEHPIESFEIAGFCANVEHFPDEHELKLIRFELCSNSRTKLAKFRFQARLHIMNKNESLLQVVFSKLKWCVWKNHQN